MSTILGYLILTIICLSLYLCLPRDMWKYYKKALIDPTYIGIKGVVFVILILVSPSHVLGGYVFVLIDPFCFWIANYKQYKSKHKDL